MKVLNEDIILKEKPEGKGKIIQGPDGIRG
jgi:hypothetical protein